MAVFLSAGVFVKEVDLSLYIPNLSTTAFGIVGLATKGPINEPVFITNTVQFTTTFGNPDPSFMGPYAALQYLNTGRQLWYVRVSEYDPLVPTDYKAKKASTTLSESSTYASVVGTVATLVTFTPSNKSLTFIVDGVSPGFSVNLSSVIAGSEDVPPATIVATLNADSTFYTYLTAYLTPTGTVGIKHKLPGSAHSIMISGSALSPNNLLGLPSAGTASPAYGTGSVAENPYILGSNVTFPVSVVTATNDTLYFVPIVTAGTADPVTVTLPAGSYTLAGLVSQLNTDTTFNAKLVASNYANQLKVSLKTPANYKHITVSTGANDGGQTIFGTSAYRAALLMNKGYPASGAGIVISSGINDKFVFTLYTTGATPTSASFYLTIPAASYDSITALVAALPSSTTVYPLPTGASVTLANLGTDNGSLAFSDVTLGSSHYLAATYTPGANYTDFNFVSTHDTAVSSNQSTCDFLTLPLLLQKKDKTTATTVLTVSALTEGTWGNALSIEIKDVTSTSFTLNLYENNSLVESYTGLVKTPTTLPDPLNPLATIPNPAYVENAINGVSSRISVTNSGLLIPNATGATKILLSGGDNGESTSSTVNPSIYIGSISGANTTGLQFFRNPENLDINLIAVPGISDAAVINELISICQFRNDCMALVDPPFGYTVQQVVDWRNGAGSFASDHQAFNSSYAALYWPWLQIYDPINKQKVWTAPSGHIANVYAFSDFTTEPWRAPAGLTRGHLTSPLLAEQNPTQGDRDLLYSNNVNPIATFIRDGINVWGQKTLQTKTSALDRVNVRRLLLYLEKVIATAARQLLFEPDDPITWQSFINLVDPFLQGVKDRRGLIEYQVRCDETTNTPDAVDRNEMNAAILIKPTKAAEFISISFVITAQSTTLSELVF